MDETGSNQSETPKSNNLEADPEFDAGLECFNYAADLILPNLNVRDTAEIAGFNAAMNIMGGVSPSLYHYTTAEGIQGIVEKGCFYASAAYYQNDSSEIDYGCRVFADILHKWCEKRGKQETVAARVPQRMNSTFHDISSMRNQLSRTCVVCFCEKPNLLSQWRAYGQNGGYSIGFDKNALERFRTDGDVFEVHLKKVIYEEHSQKEILEGFVSVITAQLENQDLGSKYNRLSDRGKAICVRACEILLQRVALMDIVRFKHPAFEEEREWRLIAQPQGARGDEGKIMAALKFRPSRGVPAPYIEVMPEVKLLPITSVRYGPTLERKRVENALDVLFKKHGYGEITVEGSDIPVRL